MAESGKTVRILFPDGHERVFHNASIDTSVDGWLHVVRLEVQEAPLSGIAAPIAGYPAGCTAWVGIHGARRADSPCRRLV